MYGDTDLPDESNRCMLKGSVSSSIPCTCSLFVDLWCRHFHGP